MDTSPEYINMCRKATELQEMWKIEEGDFYSMNPPYRGICTVHESSWCKDPMGNICATWLPRIDQLIEMLNKEFPYWTQYYGFELFRRIADVYDRDKRPGSSEKRILELLYNEKYNKYWNGKDWI